MEVCVEALGSGIVNIHSMMLRIGGNKFLDTYLEGSSSFTRMYVVRVCIVFVSIIVVGIADLFEAYVERPFGAY